MVAVGRNFGCGHDGDGVRGTFREIRRSVDGIEGDIKAGGVRAPFSQAVPKENSRGTVFDAFTNDDLSSNIDQVKDPLDGITSGGISGIFVSPTNKVHGIEGSVFGGPHELELYRTLWVEHKRLSLRP